MLRIVVNTSSAGAKRYFSSADYYSQGQELVGQWHGKGAQRLGLFGEVNKLQWDRLCDNQHPQTGDKLMPRTKAERRVGYDFNFNAPKSLSLLYDLTGDERLREAFDRSVEDTMSDIERDAATRVRIKGANTDRVTGKLVWGSYTHLTTRPVDGVPDPGLHSHCFVFNTTFDKDEGRWKAAQLGGIKRDAPYFEAVFHSLLARRMEELGLETERTRGGWTLAGLDTSLLAKFSRRTKEIETLAQELGITDPDAKGELGAQSRSKKAKLLSMPELRTEWRSRMTTQEQRAVHALAAQIGQTPRGEDAREAPQAIRRVMDTAFARASVVPERKLLAAAIKQGIGRSSRHTMETLVRHEQLITAYRDGQRMVTTREVLKEEQTMLAFARAGRGACSPVNASEIVYARGWLNSQQKNAVKHVLSSHDRVVLIRGAAGTGKTSALQELREQMEAQGVRVHAFAQTTGASRGVLRSEGFQDADTITRLLDHQELQARVRGGIILIDEAGQVGTKTMRQVFELAEKQQARVVLVGDIYQHGPVERGTALRLLETEAGLLPAQIKDIQRQKDKYKHAVQDLSEGKVAQGFATLDTLGWIHEIAVPEERERALANAYIDALKDKKSALVVSPTHAEGKRVTQEIRSRMRAKGMLDKHSVTVTSLVAANATLGEKQDRLTYLPGDVLVFHQNAKGYRKGQRVEVTADQTFASHAPQASKAHTSRAPSTVSINNIPLNQAERFSIYKQCPLEVSRGDRIRITGNATTKDDHRVNNGDLFTVKAITKRGDIQLENGWIVPKDFGHITHGFVTTSHASQGKTVDRVFIAQSSRSFPASSREQFYVSVSRARQQAHIFTDSKPTLLEAVQHSDPRLSATELVATPSQSRTIDSTRRLVRARLMQRPNVPSPQRPRIHTPQVAIMPSVEYRRER